MFRRCIYLLVLLIGLAACGSAIDQSGGTGNHAHPTQSVSPAAASPTVSGSISIVSHTITVTPTAKPNGKGPTPTATKGTSGQPPTSTPQNRLTQQLFALINHDRATQGLYPYVLNPTLSNGAYQHSVKMSHCGLSHSCPGEPDPCKRVSNEGIQWTTCGENVGYASYPDTWAGVQQIETSMLNEPPPAGHRFNLLNKNYHRIGIGILVDSKGVVWVTEDFAS